MIRGHLIPAIRGHSEPILTLSAVVCVEPSQIPFAPGGMRTLDVLPEAGFPTPITWRRLAGRRAGKASVAREWPGRCRRDPGRMSQWLDHVLCLAKPGPTKQRSNNALSSPLSIGKLARFLAMSCALGGGRYRGGRSLMYWIAAGGAVEHCETRAGECTHALVGMRSLHVRSRWPEIPHETE